MTPDRWTRDTAWKHGPRKIVVSLPPQPRPPAAPSSGRPDPLQLPETAGASTRRPLSPSDDSHRTGPWVRRAIDLLFVIAAALILLGLYLLADWMVKL